MLQLRVKTLQVLEAGRLIQSTSRLFFYYLTRSLHLKCWKKLASLVDARTFKAWEAIKAAWLVQMHCAPVEMPRSSTCDT